jgi:hypothetical protein
MARVAHTSGNHLRIRYRHTDGTIASEGGFTSLGATERRAPELTNDQHKGTHQDPIHHQITLND